MQSSYRMVMSAYGRVWVHTCPVLEQGPEWVRRERLLVDAGPRDSYLRFADQEIHFHGHLFREEDGFRFSEKDRTRFPAELLAAIETAVNQVDQKQA